MRKLELFGAPSQTSGPRRTTTRLSLLAAFAAAVHGIAAQYAFSAFGPDKVCQTAAAQAFVDGRGLSLPIVDAGLRIGTIPLQGWPPGYSVLVAGALALVGDPFRATVLIDSASVLCLLTSWWVALGTLPSSIRPQVRLLIFAFCALAFVPTTALPSTDLLALALLSAGWVLAGACGPSTSRLWLAAGLLAASCAVRYAYWPIALVVPVAAAFREPLSQVRRTLTILLAFPLAGVLALAAYMRSSTGAITYFAARHPTTGWYVGNLLKMHPFPVSVLGLDSFATDFIVKSGLPTALFSLPWLPAAVLGLALITQLRATRFESGPGAHACGSSYVYSLAALMTVVTVAMLAYLGVRFPPEPFNWALGGVWCYVQEPRYFAPTWYFFLLATVTTVVAPPRNGRWSKYLQYSCLAVLVTAGALGSARTSWRWVTYSTRDSLKWSVPERRQSVSTRIVARTQSAPEPINRLL